MEFTNQARGITNTGIIRGGEIGIDIDQFSLDVGLNDPLQSYNKRLQINVDDGLNQGGRYAIYGADGRADLNIGEAGNSDPRHPWVGFVQQSVESSLGQR